MNTLEAKVNACIDQHKEEIIAWGRDVWTHAEMGFKEIRTAKKIEEIFREKGLRVETGLAVTGVKGYMEPKKEGRTIAVIAEMDGLPIDNHPDANPETKASHCCGHNAQVAAMIGALLALSDEEIKKELDGNVVFMAVPAEEFVDVEFKNGLIEKGIIGFGGGKTELIRIGAFDDIDIAIGHHTMMRDGVALANYSTNGFVNKIVTFKGKAAHAAAEPEKGIDALNAAMLALHGVDLQREGQRDEDAIRIHSFLPRAGEAMNVIPDTAVIESSVRAKNIPAYLEASKKYDMAMKGGAMALGCGVEIKTVPGYLPVYPVKKAWGIREAVEEAAGTTYPLTILEEGFHETGSTDFGDLSCVKPVLQFRTGGFSGALHNPNIRVEDEQLAYVEAARIFALTVCKLLKNKGENAEKIVEEYEPVMTKEEFISFMESNNHVEVVMPEEI